MINYNLTVYQGASFLLAATAENSDGTAFNLSGYSLTGQIKTKYSDPDPLVELSPVVTVASSGTFSVEVPYLTTTVLPIAKLVYDIEAINASGNVVRLIGGYCDVYPEATT